MEKDLIWKWGEVGYHDSALVKLLAGEKGDKSLALDLGLNDWAQCRVSSETVCHEILVCGVILVKVCAETIDFTRRSLASKGFYSSLGIHHTILANFAISRYSCNFYWLETIKGTCSFLLTASQHIEGKNQAFRVINGTVLLADSHILRLANILRCRNWFEAVESAWSLVFKACLKISSSDKTFTKINATVLLADTKVTSLHLNLKRLGLNTFETVKSTSSFLFSACVNIECSDKALCIVNTTVFLANFISYRDLINFRSLDTLQTIEWTSSFRLEASVEISSGYKAFSKIKPAILLTNSEFSSYSKGNSEAQQDSSHIY